MRVGARPRPSSCVISQPDTGVWVDVESSLLRALSSEGASLILIAADARSIACSPRCRQVKRGCVPTPLYQRFPHTEEEFARREKLAAVHAALRLRSFWWGEKKKEKRRRGKGRDAI